MKKYPTEKIRNVVLVGGKGVGKTSLAEAILYTAKCTSRLGRIQDGNTLADYDPLEISRKQTLYSKILALEWKGCKINLIDTPGYADFVGEVLGALWAADVAVIVLDGTLGMDVPAKRFFQMAKQFKKPCFFYLNKCDASQFDLQRCLANIRSVGEAAHLLQIPIGAGPNFKGVGDLATMKGIPTEFQEEAKSLRTTMMEDVAETDEKLLEKYLEQGEMSEEELRTGLRSSFAQAGIHWIFCGSALQNMGPEIFLDAVVEYFPDPSQMEAPPLMAGGKEIQKKPDPTGSPLCQVFKSTSDPGLGDLFYLKIFGGELVHGLDLYNVTKSSPERLGHLFVVRGKERTEVEGAWAGDIVVTAKLKSTAIGDTLGTKQENCKMAPIGFPEPMVSLALKTKSKQDQDKLGLGLAKFMANDPTFRINIDKEFGETIVSGLGEQHIEVTVEKLKERFGIEVELGKPHIPYRETITRRSEVQGKYKRQTGGHGQYGDCWLRLEPLPHGKGYEFVDGIVGGKIPNKYIPAVEKGVKEAMGHGILAGYPVMDVKVTVYDGSYHDVDSSDLAFQIAGSMAFKKGEEEAGPQLLEPIMSLETTAPSSYVGDLTSDISARRGRVGGMDQQGEVTILHAQVPLAELYKYSTNLRSITSGAGSYAMHFSHYESVPSHIAQKIIAESKREKEATH